MDARKKSDLIEKLKGLYKRGKKDTTGLESYMMVMPALRQLIKDEEAAWTCRSCGGELIILKWSKEVVDLITCDNFHCNSYRNPVGTIKK